MPLVSFQTPLSTLATPISGPGVQNDPFFTASRFSKEELYPPPDPADVSSKSFSPFSAFDLFSEHLLNDVLPRHSIQTKEDTEETIQETWMTLPEEIRRAWEIAEQTARSNFERAKAAEDWKKTVGNRSKSVGVRPIDVDDDDVIMVGAEDAQRR